MQLAAMPQDSAGAVIEGNSLLPATLFTVYGPKAIDRAELHPVSLLSGLASCTQQLPASVFGVLLVLVLFNLVSHFLSLLAAFHPFPFYGGSNCDSGILE